jgi:hypothetical protein
MATSNLLRNCSLVCAVTFIKAAMLLHCGLSLFCACSTSLHLAVLQHSAHCDNCCSWFRCALHSACAHLWYAWLVSAT